MGQRESEGFYRSGFGLAAQPARFIHTGGHFARPQALEHLIGLRGGHPLHHPPARATPQQGKHQTRLRWGAPVDAAPHLQSAAPALHPRQGLFGHIKFGPPQQRGIGKHPQRRFATPLGSHLGQGFSGVAVPQQGIDRRAGLHHGNASNRLSAMGDSQPSGVFAKSRG